LPKTVLDAGTDQALAVFRDMRDGLPDGESGDFYRTLSALMAAQFREEFPGIPVGRVLVAVATALKAIATGLGKTPAGAHPYVLMAITALAGEQLDREAREPGGRAVALGAPVGCLWDGAPRTVVATLTLNRLLRGGYRTVGELTAVSAADLGDLRNFGAGCLAETRRVLAARGRSLAGETAAAGEAGCG
jgi:hypothetical protein